MCRLQLLSFKQELRTPISYQGLWRSAMNSCDYLWTVMLLRQRLQSQPGNSAKTCLITRSGTPDEVWVLHTEPEPPFITGLRIYVLKPSHPSLLFCCMCMPPLNLIGTLEATFLPARSTDQLGPLRRSLLTRLVHMPRDTAAEDNRLPIIILIERSRTTIMPGTSAQSKGSC